MIGIAAAWIALLLSGGGFALDRVISQTITTNFDDNLEYLLVALIRSAEVGRDGRIDLVQQPSEQRFIEPYSGLYWQISGTGAASAGSRSLWDRTLSSGRGHSDDKVHAYDSAQFQTEPLRIVERDVLLPNSPVIWRFQVAQSRAALDAQLAQVRRVIVRSFAILGLGLTVLAALQTIYGLWPLRRIRTGIAALRQGDRSLLEAPMPNEVRPMVDELGALIEHSDHQAEEARRHAGNLAHALKTPLTVLTNAAVAREPDLDATVAREAAAMKRHVDHHLARARAAGRRGQALLCAEVLKSVEGVERAVARLYPRVRFDADGDPGLRARIERQDLDEVLGNLLENAAKYGGGSVFATVAASPPARDGTPCLTLTIEDDGPGIAEEDRDKLFRRGVRLDTDKPGTGLGLAIVRDVVETYGGSVRMEESEDLGGLAVIVTLPAAEAEVAKSRPIAQGGRA